MQSSRAKVVSPRCSDVSFLYLGNLILIPGRTVTVPEGSCSFWVIFEIIPESWSEYRYHGHRARVHCCSCGSSVPSRRHDNNVAGENTIARRPRERWSSRRIYVLFRAWIIHTAWLLQEHECGDRSTFCVPVGKCLCSVRIGNRLLRVSERLARNVRV